jgi:hypothetical protein
MLGTLNALKTACYQFAEPLHERADKTFSCGEKKVARLSGRSNRSMPRVLLRFPRRQSPGHDMVAHIDIELYSLFSRRCRCLYATAFGDSLTRLLRWLIIGVFT